MILTTHLENNVCWKLVGVGRQMKCTYEEKERKGGDASREVMSAKAWLPAQEVSLFLSLPSQLLSSWGC